MEKETENNYIDFKCNLCGCTSHYENEGYRFCTQCGGFENLTSQATQIESQKIASQSLICKEDESLITYEDTSRKSETNIENLNNVILHLALVLSKILNSSEIHDRIGKLWTIFIYKFYTKTLQKKSKSNLLNRSNPIPSKLIIFRLCFFAIKSLGINFTLNDFKMLIIDGNFNFFQFEPDIYIISKSHFLDGDLFYVAIQNLGTFISNDLPYHVNYISYIHRFVYELKFSDIILRIACALQEIFTKCHKSQKKVDPNICYYAWVELYSISLVLYAARMYFSAVWTGVKQDLKPISKKYFTNIRIEYDVWFNSISNFQLCKDECISYFMTEKSLKNLETCVDSKIFDYMIRFFIQSFPEKQTFDEKHNVYQSITHTLTEIFESNFSQNDEKELEISSQIEVLPHPITMEDVDMDFTNMTKPLRQSLYNLPCVLIDSNKHFNFMVSVAALKVGVSDRFLLSILFDVQRTLLFKKSRIQNC